MTFQRVGNDLEDSINISCHIVVPEAKDKITHCLQYFCSLLIMLCTNGMLSAVEFNNEMRISAEEIDDETIDWKLPPKFPSAETAVA
jgi:hypothetical protein